MHTQVNGNQQDVFRKDVRFFGPAAYSAVATLPQLGIEECVERVHRGKVGLLAALHQQVHVKVDHLRHGGEFSADWTHKWNRSVRKR